MKSYQLINPPSAPDVRRQVMMAAMKLYFLGLVVTKVQLNQGITMTVEPNRATRSLQSAYIGQGWNSGRMYKSYAAIVDDITVIWHKPMRAPLADSVKPWPGYSKREAAA